MLFKVEFASLVLYRGQAMVEAASKEEMTAVVENNTRVTMHDMSGKSVPVTPSFKWPVRVLGWERIAEEGKEEGE
jgi:hypothetical protein